MLIDYNINVDINNTHHRYHSWYWFDAVSRNSWAVRVFSNRRLVADKWTHYARCEYTVLPTLPRQQQQL